MFLRTKILFSLGHEGLDANPRFLLSPPLAMGWEVGLHGPSSQTWLPSLRAEANVVSSLFSVRQIACSMS